MPVLEKDILRPGEWVVENQGDMGVFNASPARISHFAQVGAEMLQSGLKIPVIWEHTADENDKAGLPLTAAELAHDDAARYTRNTAGYVTQFGVGEHGELMARINVEGPDAEKIGTVIHDVSPFIREEFCDGNGNVWNDAICHVALTTQPVVTNQGQFRTVALSHGHSLKFVRLSRPYQAPKSRLPEPPEDEEEDDNEWQDDAAAEQQPVGADSDMDLSTYLQHDEEQPAEQEPEAIDPELIQDLALHGIVIPENTSAADLVAHLKTALRTSAAHKRMASAARTPQPTKPAGQGRVAPGTKPAGQPTEETTSVALSNERESRLERALFAERRDALRRRLGECLRTGRCTAHQHDRIASRIGSVKLSLSNAGRVVDNAGVEDQVALLEANPLGAQFTPDQASTLFTEHDNSKFFEGNADAMTSAEAKHIADLLHGAAK